MIHKFIEVLDEGTRIYTCAIKLECKSPVENHFVNRTGYTDSTVILLQLQPCTAHYNPYNWQVGRTMRLAHRFIQEHFDVLEDGGTVDVQIHFPYETKSWLFEKKGE